MENYMSFIIRSKKRLNLDFMYTPEISSFEPVLGISAFLNRQLFASGSSVGLTSKI